MTHTKPILVLALFALALSLAAATSGSISLSGATPVILDITVTAEAAASSLPLNTTVTDLKVGTVVERSNKKAGYTVTISSANAQSSGSLSPSLRSAQTSDFLPYSIKYGGVSVNFNAGGTAALVSSVTGKTAAAGTSNTVTISFDGSSKFLDEAPYSDTLTFTIIAK